MILAFDIDGVVADFTGHVISKLKDNGLDIKREDFLTWGLEHLKLDKIVNDLSDNIDYSLLNPLPGMSVINDLANFGYSVVFITARNSKHREATENWLFRHLNQKYPVYFSKNKLAENWDILVDDSPELAAQFEKSDRRGSLVVMDFPYNREFIGLRAKNLKDVKRMLL